MPRVAAADWNIAKLEQMLSTRRGELKKLEKQRSAAERRLAGIDRKISALGGSVGGGRRGGGRTRPQNDHPLPDVIEMVLRDHGKPMRVGDIVSGVESKGYRSGSANFKGIVNQQLIKDKRFGAVSRGLYQLKK